MRYFWMMVGFVSLALGAAGTILPLVPTTPFMLLSAFCFARSSPRFHDWLMTRSGFGPLIEDWRQHGAISFNAKLLATIAIALTVAVSLVMRVDTVVLAIHLLIFGPGLIFLWTRPTAKTPSRHGT